MRRGPEDQYAEFFLYVMKPVLDSGGYEHQAAGLDRPLLVRDGDHAPPADHVVDLVLAVRPQGLFPRVRE